MSASGQKGTSVGNQWLGPLYPRQRAPTIAGPMSVRCLKRKWQDQFGYPHGPLPVVMAAGFAVAKPAQSEVKNARHAAGGLPILFDGDGDFLRNDRRVERIMFGVA